MYEIILGYLKPYKITIDGKKNTFKNHIVLGSLDCSTNIFSGREYDEKNEAWGDISWNKEEFSKNVQSFHIIAK